MTINIYNSKAFMHRYCLTSRLTLSSRTRRPRFDSVQKIFLIRRDLLGGAVLVQRHPWLLHRVQADHVAFGIDHEGNVAVLANQRESTSPNPQPREQTLPRWAGTCARSHSSRDVPRIGLMGFSGSRATSKSRDWKWITGCMVWGLTPALSGAGTASA